MEIKATSTENNLKNKIKKQRIMKKKNKYNIQLWQAIHIQLCWLLVCSNS